MTITAVSAEDWARLAPCSRCGVTSGPCLRLDRESRKAGLTWKIRPHDERRVVPELRLQPTSYPKACRCCGVSRAELPATSVSRRRFTRGLCGRCYKNAFDHGTLDLYPRVTRRSADVAEDYADLLAFGEVRCYREGAERLDVSYEALIKAVERYRPDLLVRRAA